MNDAPPTPAKDTWPRTRWGTIDWETVFESPDTGFIAMVEQSSAVFILEKCCELIIESLFNREGDEDFRVAYLEQMQQTLKIQKTLGAELDAQKAAIIEILRVVKVNRQQRAEDFAAEKQAAAETAAASDGQSESDEAVSADDPEGAFIMAVSDQFAERMAALREGVNPDSVIGGTPPFPVSEAFARNLKAIIREYIAPEMADRCRALVNLAGNTEPADRYQTLRDAMGERRNREALWDAWRLVWHEATNQQEMPEKPIVPEKKGLLSKFASKNTEMGAEGELITLDEWKIEKTRVKTANAQAKENWTAITAEDEAYQAPEDSDNKLLMNLFARTAEAMTKQINAIRQIAEQGGNAGKIFADYQQGKDIDLPLLVACCQRPDMFLRDGLLKDFLKGFPENMRRQHFELVSRFFADHI